jgi:H/ACA ribonucleoprotein complex subunit 4
MRLHSDVPEEEIRNTLSQFIGEIYQRPPLRSSVKRVLRKRIIYYIKDVDFKKKYVLFKVGCQAGTYIRKLCFDIGELLGTGAHMVELRRTQVGPFRDDDSIVTLYDIYHAFHLWKDDGDESYIRKIVQPVENALKLIPKIYTRDSAVDALCHGASLAIPGIIKLHSGITPNNIVGLFTQKGELIALAKSIMSSEKMMKEERGIAATIERVIMPLGTYPPLWKKRKKEV